MDIKSFLDTYKNTQVLVRRPCDHSPGWTVPEDWDHYYCSYCDGEGWLEYWVYLNPVHDSEDGFPPGK